MVYFVRGEKFYIEPTVMLLHSDDGKKLRLGYKTLILKYEVVYQNPD